MNLRTNMDNKIYSLPLNGGQSINQDPKDQIKEVFNIETKIKDKCSKCLIEGKTNEKILVISC